MNIYRFPSRSVERESVRPIVGGCRLRGPGERRNESVQIARDPAVRRLPVSSGHREYCRRLECDTNDSGENREKY